MAYTVTATEGANAVNGVLLRVKVLTGAAAAASQTGASKTADAGSSPFYDQSITTTVTGSIVYGALADGANNSAFTADARTTLIDNFSDGVQFCQYATWRATSATGTPGATTLGASSNAGDHGVYAAAEILPSGTITEDASAPAAASTTAATAVTTASFTPPAGSLLVAIVSHCSSGVSSITISNTGGTLIWTQLAYISVAGGTGNGVWVAQVPAAGGGVAAAVPGQTWLRRFHHRQQPGFPPGPVAAAVVPPAEQMLLPPRYRAVAQRARLGRAATVAAGILAVTTLSPQPSSVPPSRPAPSIGHPAPHRAITRRLSAPPQLPGWTAKLPPTAVSPRPPHRASWRGVLAKTTLSPQPASVPAPPWRQPNAPRPAHRVVWRGIAGPAPAVVVVAAVPPSRPQPVTSRPPAPHRAIGRGILAATTFSAQPARVPPPQWRQPNAPRPPHRAYWRGIAGPAPAVVAATPAAPSRPQPVTSRPPAPHRATWRRITGTTAPLPPPARPQPVTNRPPAPHRAIWRGVLAKTTLSAQPARVPGPLWRQPNAPRPPHRAYWRAISGTAPPPPPFTIGQLTAADVARNALTAAQAAGSLTTTGQATAALTASDKRTGGPGG